VKALPGAKSRLRAGTAPGAHAELVEAMRADVLDAVRATPKVARVVVVADNDQHYPADVTIRQRQAGLNGAIRDGADHAAGHWPDDGVAALVGDLPALRPEELASALEAAAAHPEAFVPDADGTGTTLLTAAPGHPLRPEFGPGSAARHARHAVRLDGVGAGLRRDVDTAADLAAALLHVMPGSR
jgi:2-phospho-L-lactate guanylyltransferase